MIGYSKTIFQVVQDSNESAPDAFSYNDGNDSAEIVRYTKPLLLEFYPDTNPSLLLPKSVFLINPFNNKQLIPADRYYEFLIEEEMREINFIAPKLGAIDVEASWEKDKKEKISKSQEFGGNLWVISAKTSANKTTENQESKFYGKKSRWEKQKPDLKYFENLEFKEKFPIISNNDDIKGLIEVLKSGSKPPEYYEINRTRYETNIRHFEQMFKFAIPYLGFECKIMENYERIEKENYSWKLIFKG